MKKYTQFALTDNSNVKIKLLTISYKDDLISSLNYINYKMLIFCYAIY